MPPSFSALRPVDVNAKFRAWEAGEGTWSAPSINDRASLAPAKKQRPIEASTCPGRRRAIRGHPLASEFAGVSGTGPASRGYAPDERQVPGTSMSA